MSKFLFYSLFVTFVLVFPFTATAQGGIADSSFVTCDGVEMPCQPCHLVQMANNIIEFLIIILTVVAALIFAYAGFILTTSGGDTTARDRAKTIFTNVLIGYIIVLSAWLLIDTGMKVLLDDEEVGPWNEIECKDQPTLQERDISWDDSDWIDGVHSRTGVPYSEEAAQDNAAARRGDSLELSCDGETIEVQSCDESNIVSTNLFGHSVQVHRGVVSSLERIDREWRNRGGSSYYEVYSVGGYNCRGTASGGTSLHAYGLAIDINPNENPHCPTWSQCNGRNVLITDMDEQDPPFYTLFTSEGWGWGGNWNSSKDAMHFSKGRHETGDMSCN